MPIQVNPRLGAIDGRNVTLVGMDAQRVKDYMQDKEGVILGTIGSQRHAVAWERGRIYDPNGYPLKLEQIDLHQFIQIL